MPPLAPPTTTFDPFFNGYRTYLVYKDETNRYSQSASHGERSNRLREDFIDLSLGTNRNATGSPIIYSDTPNVIDDNIVPETDARELEPTASISAQSSRSVSSAPNSISQDAIVRLNAPFHRVAAALARVPSRYERLEYWKTLRDFVLAHYGLTFRSAEQAFGIKKRTLTNLGKHMPRGVTVAPLVRAHAIALGLINAEGDSGKAWLVSQGRHILFVEGINALDAAVMERIFPPRLGMFARERDSFAHELEFEEAEITEPIRSTAQVETI